MDRQRFRMKNNGFKFFHILLTINILTVLICSATLSLILNSRFNQTLNKQNEEFMQYATSQALNGIENIMKNCELIARNIYSDSTTANLFLAAYDGNVDYTLFHQFMDMNNRFENYIATNNDIRSITIYKLDPKLITDGKNIQSIESFGRQDLMKKAMDARGKDVWVAYEEAGQGTKILLLKYINIHQPGGVLAIEMNLERLNNLYKGDPNANYLFYLRSEGATVFSSNPDVQLDPAAWDDVEQHVQSDRVYSTLQQGPNQYYTYYGRVNSALTAVILYNAYELGKEKRSIASYVLIGTCFFVLFGVACAIWFSTRFASIIEKLANKIKAIEKGNLQLSPDASGIREIAALDHTLCHMAHTIDGLTADIAKTERQKVESEIKYLQMQMNPHFLYNLLSAVRWMAFHKSEHTIVHIIDLLSDFYKIALSQGRDLIAIQSEIQLIEHYVALQNCCLSEQIKLSVRLDPALESLSICKMTLQPFVENCIIHGRVHGQILHIKVDILKQDEHVRITIWDDGMGVKESFIAYMESLNQGAATTHKVGYGVTNTFTRLRLFYRSARIQVHQGHPGTVVELSFSLEDNGEPEQRLPYKNFILR